VTQERLAEAIRELIEQVTTTAAPDAALADAVSAVQSATERLRAAGSPRTLSFRRDEAGDGPGAWTYLRLSPVSGVLNPLAPPVHLELGSGEVEGTATFGVAHQGPPGYVHGALIAAAFDELLGAANAASGNPGMTVRLDVRYLRPTPLRTPVRFVGRHTGRQGRRISAAGSLLAGGVVTAEAEGVFAEITMDRAKELFAGMERDSPV